MTTTIETQGAPTPGGPGVKPVEGRVLPTPPKARRRWGVLAAMVALVGAGAVGNVWLHEATTNAGQVVAARSTIERGAVIARDQLVAVQIGTDPAVRSVPASRLEGLVGQRAALDVASGSLLTPDSVSTENVPSRGQALVGVGVMPEMMPGAPLRAGDRIQVVATPGQQGDPAATANPVSITAVVVSTQTGADTTGRGAASIITVQVPAQDAARLAAMAATGKVAIVLDSRDR